MFISQLDERMCETLKLDMPAGQFVTGGQAMGSPTVTAILEFAAAFLLTVFSGLAIMVTRPAIAV